MLHRLNPRNWPLTVRTAAELLVAALVPLAIGTRMASSRGMAALEQEARTNLELLASVTATQLDQLMEDTTKPIGIVDRPPTRRPTPPPVVTGPRRRR